MFRNVCLVHAVLLLFAALSVPVQAQEWSDNGSPASNPISSTSSTAETDWLNDIDYSSDYMSSDYVNAPAEYFSDCETHRCGFYAGAELVIVKPYWEDEVDTLKEVLVIDDIEFPTVIALDPGYDCSLSPRVYVGHRNCSGFGGRVRYWLYDEAANPLLVDEFGNELTLNADLNVQALDAEFTKLLTNGQFSLEFGGGARYGRTKVEASLRNENEFFTTFYSGRATFEGVGPTIFGEARHQLGGSHFAVIGNLRGSLLFGQSNAISIREEEIPSTLINKGKDDVVPVIESQFGVEYARCLGHGRLALRALMEGQWWGVSTPGASFSRELQGVPGLNIDQFNTGRDLGFFGVTAGVTYEH